MRSTVASAAAALATVERITGKPVARVEGRSYVYGAGQYLLPHADHRPGVARAVAFAYYLTPAGGCEGGDLELFECAIEGGEIVSATSAKAVAHHPNRLVLFDVSP